MENKLFLIGIGLNDPKDITLKGLEAIKQADKVYLEEYTSIMQCSIKDLEEAYKVKILPLDRKSVEQKLETQLQGKNTALLIIGDPFGATTHSSLCLEAKKKGIDVEIIHNTSIMNAIGETGLELYKFGRTVSLPYPNDGVLPLTAFENIMQNSKMGLHTLCLLDIKKDEDKFMTVREAIDLLFGMGLPKHTNGVGIARLGSKNQIIKYGKLSELENIDFGKPPHSLILPSKLHFIEEEMLNTFSL